MIQFLGSSENVVHIARKPHSTGLRYYIYCSILSVTNRPVCYHVLPELRIPKYTPSEVLTDLHNLLPDDNQVSCTVDAFFGSLPWLSNHHENVSMTMALNSGHYSDLVELFGYQLQPHQYRTFTDGKLILTLWKDNKLMFTVSNEFEYIETNEVDYRGIDTTTIEPLLSKESIELIAQGLSSAELSGLATALGVSKSNNFISFLLIFLLENNRWNKERYCTCHWKKNCTSKQ